MIRSQPRYVLSIMGWEWGDVVEVADNTTDLVVMVYGPRSPFVLHNRTAGVSFAYGEALGDDEALVVNARDNIVRHVRHGGWPCGVGYTAFATPPDQPFFCYLTKGRNLLELVPIAPHVTVNEALLMPERGEVVQVETA